MGFLCCLGQFCINVTSECTTYCLLSMSYSVIPSYVAWRLTQVFLSNVEPGDLVRVELGDWVCLQPEDDDEFNLPLPPIGKTKRPQQIEDMPWMYTPGALYYCLLSWTNLHWYLTIRDGQEPHLGLTLTVLSIQCREEYWLSLWFQNKSCQLYI